ncbi:MAG: ComF family protein, partial [Burkholderiales bacterium]|nr:ComF family protein [Burkholderiales bacterium]
MPAAWPAPAPARPAWRPRLHAPCEVCRRWSASVLCPDCIARYASPRPSCARCGLGLGMASAACGACLREPPPFEQTVCAADYAFPWVGLIAEFKFRGRVELAGALGGLLATAVRRAVPPRPALLLPVP